MTIHQSKVGAVMDVATPAEKKLKQLAGVWIVGSLVPLFVINYAIYDFLVAGGTFLNVHDIVPLIGFLMMPFAFWFALASARHRFYTAGMKDRYFRAGSGGVSICISKS